SAMGAGMMFLVLVRILYAYWYNPEPVFGPRPPVGLSCPVSGSDPITRKNFPRGKDLSMLIKLAAVGSGILGVYLVLKIFDLFRQGAWSALTAGTWESWLYLFELLATSVIPLALVIVRRTRRSPVALGIAATSATFGMALNRMDVGIFGYFRDAQTVYFPSLAEWAVSFGVVAAAGLMFFFVIENFNIIKDVRPRHHLSDWILKAVPRKLNEVRYSALMSRLHSVTLIAVLTIPIGWVLLYPPFHNEAPGREIVQAATGADITRAVLRIDGDRQGMATEFAHAEHQKRLGGDSSCATCHHVSMPGDRSTPCSRCHRDMLKPTVIFVHSLHTATVAKKENLTGWHPTNRSCVVCHEATGPKTTRTAKRCYDCHREDMWLVGQPDSTLEMTTARSFREAMHANCITCHQRESEKVGRPALAECATCHHTLKSRETSQLAVDM
ncbi:MAG: hypothetical protein JXA92_05275, partial [candidate division Zixibacteria bacterium]|nr:hypothetical protein [candidate division Zixibacteria bacterium]